MFGRWPGVRLLCWRLRLELEGVGIRKIFRLLFDCSGLVMCCRLNRLLLLLRLLL